MEKAAMMVKARRLVRNVSDLPTIPAMVSRMIALLDSNEADPDEIANLMLSEPVLAARIIRIVNSPLYRSSSEITSVRRALLYMGFRSMREIIMTSYFVNAFQGKPQAFAAKIFWTHSFSVGAIAQRIAAMVNYPDLEKAGLVAIVHDIGKVFMGHYLLDDYARMLADITETNCSTYQAELDHFGTTHCEVGLCLAQSWNFPPVYCDIISHHHSCQMATEDPLLAAIVSVADFACLQHAGNGIAQPGPLSTSENHAWHVISQQPVKLPEQDFYKFIESLDTTFVEIDREVRHVLISMMGS
ncbi:HDOD domain-containing protein [Pelotalea chapellei]|uniref:HDOD domain-containing protein n=1 Tax=Pelotalea chapellei TaxID=44671 RepID=A0ABS5UCU2_9BACT|nr:HDOD domain-containing protein [Pelotalea chapellei]